MVTRTDSVNLVKNRACFFGPPQRPVMKTCLQFKLQLKLDTYLPSADYYDLRDGVPIHMKIFRH